MDQRFKRILWRRGTWSYPHPYGWGGFHKKAFVRPGRMQLLPSFSPDHLQCLSKMEARKLVGKNLQLKPHKEDLEQIGLLAAYRALEARVAPKIVSPEGYIRAVVRNSMIDYLRKIRREPVCTTYYALRANEERALVPTYDEPLKEWENQIFAQQVVKDIKSHLTRGEFKFLMKAFGHKLPIADLMAKERTSHQTIRKKKNYILMKVRDLMRLKGYNVPEMKPSQAPTYVPNYV